MDIVDIWRSTVDTLATEQAIAAPVAPVSFQQLAIEYEARVNPVWPMPGLLSCLAVLRSAGMVLGIVSNAQFFTPMLFPALVGKSVTELGFAKELCVWSFQHGHAKPGPFLYQQQRQLLASQGIQPGEILYVGNDMLNDVLPAQQVGFRTGLFAGDQRSLRKREGDGRVANISPDGVFTHLDQIALAVGASDGSEVN